MLPAGHPEEDETVVLEDGNIKVLHLVVGERAVRQLHVDVPWRVGHHHRKLAEHLHVERAHVTLHPLQIPIETREPTSVVLRLAKWEL